MIKLFAILFLPLSVFSQNIVDLKGGILKPDSILKNVTIKNAIIEANPYIQIFDTTVTLQNCKTREFSTAWYGASPSIADNSPYLQKSISTCIANNMDLSCAESYTTLKPLLAFKLVNGKYTGFGFNFYGDGDRWNQRQTITYKGNEFAYGVQVAKGGSIRGISFVGNNSGTGIVIDYDGTKNASGSTGFSVTDTRVGNFEINYDISPKGTHNGDILRLTNIKSGKCKIGVRSSSAQNKGNEIIGYYSWDSCGTAFQITGGNWIVRGANIANYCERILNINVSGWNTFSIHGLFGERVYSLGYVNAKNSVYSPPVNLQDMDIRFIPGDQVLFTSNSPKVRISNSFLVFYNGICCQQMNFQGPFIWDNNDCGNCEIDNPSIQYIIPQPQHPITFR